jgi:hypothetical protein
MALVVHVTKSKSVAVASFAEAAKLVVAQWGSKSYHAMYRDPKAGIIEQDGVPYAHVSYNGRVWATPNRLANNAPEIAI